MQGKATIAGHPVHPMLAALFGFVDYAERSPVAR